MSRTKHVTILSFIITDNLNGRVFFTQNGNLVISMYPNVTFVISWGQFENE
jgi:hypothetical protein